MPTCTIKGAPKQALQPHSLLLGAKVFRWLPRRVHDIEDVVDAHIWRTGQWNKQLPSLWTTCSVLTTHYVYIYIHTYIYIYTYIYTHKDRYRFASTYRCTYLRTRMNCFFLCFTHRRLFALYSSSGASRRTIGAKQDKARHQTCESGKDFMLLHRIAAQHPTGNAHSS